MWAELIVPVVLALVVLALPGLVLGLALGLRGVWLAASAAPLSLSAIATAAILADWAGVRWSVLPVAGTAVLAAVLIAVGRRVLAGEWRPARWNLSGAWPVVVAVALAGVLLGRRLGVILQRPDAVSQSYDNVFHLNAVAYVERTGSASPFSLGGMTTEGSLGFYPSGWHAVVSLVADLGRLDVPLAVNGVILAVSCVVWPLSIIMLTRTWFGTGRTLTIAAGVFAASCATYPFLIIHYGVLYPLFLSGAVLPLVVAALAAACGVGRSDGPRSSSWVLLVGVVPGLSVAHPSALVAVLAFSLPIATVVAVVRLRGAAGRLRLAVAAAYVAYLVMGAVAVRVIRPPSDQIYWPTIETTAQAVGEVLTNGAYGMPVSWGLSVAALVGLVAAVRRPGPGGVAAAGGLVVTGVLFVVVASWESDAVRTFLTGPWYSNPPRLAALLPVAVVPLAAWGVAVMVAAARREAEERRWWPGDRRVIWAGALGGVLVLVAVTLIGGPMRQITVEAQRGYALVDDAWFLTPDEMALLERLPEVVPEDGVVAGNPWTGAGMALAFADRGSLMPHLLMEIDEDTETINDGLRGARPGSETCRALERKNVEYVLDFGDLQINNETTEYPGLEDLDRSAAVEEVDREGDAVLYRVVGC